MVVAPTTMATDRALRWLVVAVVVTVAPARQPSKQHFISQPREVSVTVGESVLLECEVGEQAGRVQWAKDGFVMGFNRSIPTNHRYTMVGAPTKGSHHLRISEARISDDADFQCQVGPADGHPAIRATGHLTVLAPPASVTLLSRGRGGTLEVSEGQDLSMQCTVAEAKPVASVVWYKNGERIALESRSDTPSPSHPLRHLVSSITLPVSAGDDGAAFSCRAEHPALASPLVASVSVSVLYPPGAPVIAGYSEGETMREGEERPLTCSSRGGNPPAKVVWLRDGVVLDTSDSMLDAVTTVNSHTLSVNASDNGVIFTCQVSNKLTEVPLSASVKLAVHFGPASVKVSGPNQARVGANVTVRCETAPSSPPAALSWVVGGAAHRAGGTDRRERHGTGWRTFSSITITVPTTDRDLMFTCHASNPDLPNRAADQTYVLSVLRPPQPPVIHGYAEGTGLPVGQPTSVRCVSRGGNPPATLQWYRDEKRVESMSHTLDDVTTAEITVEARSRDNLARLRCEASNSASIEPLSVATTLVVHFPPDHLKVSVAPHPLIAGSPATLTCRTGGSNPPATVRWERGDGKRFKGEEVDRSVGGSGGTRITNVLTVNLTSADDAQSYTCIASNSALELDVRDTVTLSVRYAPEFGKEPPSLVDIEVGGSYTLNLTATANPGPITYLWSRLGEPISKSVLKDVTTTLQGTPASMASHENYHHQRELQSGERRVMSATAAVINLQQKIDSRRSMHQFQQMESPNTMVSSLDSRMGGVAADGPLLRITNIQIAHGGAYELAASNPQGETRITVLLNVKYPPRVQYTSGEVQVGEGERASLECTAEGNPLTRTMMTWRREGYSFEQSQHTFSNQKSVLHIAAATSADTGVFTCHVDNGVGAPSEANVTLIVRSKPTVDRSQLLSRAAADVGLTGVLTCAASGAPDVSFSWRRDGLLLTAASQATGSRKFTNETTKTGLVTWQSQFFIRSVEESDYGLYECVAENALGANPTTVNFTAPSVPQQPLALEVLNTSHSAVKLSWEPGFDGGKRQYFRIRYRDKANTYYQYKDVHQADARSDLVTGLEMDTEYYFSIMSFNDVGGSQYRGEYVGARTSDEAPPPVPSSNVGRKVDDPTSSAKTTPAQISSIWAIFIFVVAIALLSLNVFAIVCIVRRRRRRRGDTGVSSPSANSSSSKNFSKPKKKASKKQRISLKCSAKSFALSSSSARSGVGGIHDHYVTGDKGNLPKLIIIVVVCVGTTVVIVNIALVIFLLRRKRGRLHHGMSNKFGENLFSR